MNTYNICNKTSVHYCFCVTNNFKFCSNVSFILFFQIGFSEYTQAFADYQVDGDLLLTLVNESLRDDLKMDNGLTRKRCKI